MTTNNKKNKKNSAARKLIPAIGMLTVSAMMLSSSTYAWFTMSREVEVTNISMVATTPEDIQISLGRIGTTASTPETSGSGKSLSNGNGVLVEKTTGSGASNGQVAEPAEDWDWSNTADFSKYYAIGKLIPASSTSGANVFFTPDANGVGKTVRTDAKYYRADSSINGASGAADSGSTGSYKATLHAFTADNGSDKWASMSGTATSGAGDYKKSTAWNATNDDGYYVDIPIWLRTSSTETTNIVVKGYVAPKTEAKANSNDESLYKAVRVAILNATDNSGSAASATGLLPLADGYSGSRTNNNSGALNDTPFAAPSILNFYQTTNNSGAVDSLSGYSGTYGSGTVYDPANAFVSLAPGTGAEYGTPSKFIVRVWLEGNDPDCWNDTAGQDWYINLKFGKSGEMDGANIAGAKKIDGTDY